MAQESKFQQGGPDPKERIMQQILATKTLYDAEFERIQKTFGPMLQHLDNGRPRTILFIDPLKVASAEAYGISPVEFLQYELRQKNLSTDNFVLAHVFNNASYGSIRPLMYAAGTNPMSIPVTDAFRQNGADIVIPKTHLTDWRINIRGMTQAQVTSYVNYHEFFHCIHDKYDGGAVRPNVHQKREMFADVGALMQMIREGSDPKIIDMAIDWRERGKDAAHATIPALEGLKDYVSRNGIDKIRKMTDKELIETCYKISDKEASNSFVYTLQDFWGNLPDLTTSSGGGLTDPLKHLPKGWSPTKVLEDKAMALGNKVTPKTLMLANNALQAEYAALRDKNPASQQYMWMMVIMEDTYVKRVNRTNYEKVNAERKATLTAEDREDISFVKKSKSQLRNAPVYSPQGFTR